MIPLMPPASAPTTGEALAGALKAARVKPGAAASVHTHLSMVIPHTLVIARGCRVAGNWTTFQLFPGRAAVVGLRVLSSCFRRRGTRPKHGTLLRRDTGSGRSTYAP